MNFGITKTVAAIALSVADDASNLLVATRASGEKISIAWVRVDAVEGLANRFQEMKCEDKFATIVFWNMGDAVVTSAPNLNEARGTAFHYNDELDGQ